MLNPSFSSLKQKFLEILIEQSFILHWLGVPGVADFWGQTAQSGSFLFNEIFSPARPALACSVLSPWVNLLLLDVLWHYSLFIFFKIREEQDPISPEQAIINYLYYLQAILNYWEKGISAIAFSDPSSWSFLNDFRVSVEIHLQELL